MPAPMKPPMRACDEDVGSPSYQVARFQPIAPTSPPKMTATLTTDGSTILPTVSATLVWNTRKATKLNTAAQRTAALGDNTLVETTVAIELAASWKPLVKSKTRASSTSPITTSRPPSGILQHDPL